MRVRYTASRSLAQFASRAVFDMEGTASYFRSANAFINRSQPFIITGKFYIGRSTLSPRTYQRLVLIDDFIILDANTDGKFRVYKTSDVASAAHNVSFDFKKENTFTLGWNGGGYYYIECNGVYEYGTISTYTSDTGFFQVGASGGSFFTNGYVYDVTVTYGVGLTSISTYALDDSASTANDSTGANDLTLYKSSPEPEGWKFVTPQHAAGRQYTQTLYLRSLDRKREVDRNEVVSLSGIRQNTYMRGENTWRAVTTPMTGEAMITFREFLDSVEDGSVFEFDTGDFLWKRVVIDGDGYTENRAVQRGDGGENDYFSVGFSFREA